MKNKIILVPDTNFFVQCKEPHTLSWQQYSEYEEIELIITRPVQSELDSQKGKGSGRLAKRARKASTMIRELILSDDTLKIRENKPKVTLHIRQDLTPDASYSEILSYTEKDDQLVGITSSLAKITQDADVAILTDDTGPMASAKMIKIRFDAIPETWLLPPETDESEKRLKSIMTELEAYKDQEPKFEISLYWKDSLKESIDHDVAIYEELTPKEISSLRNAVVDMHPEEHDFGPTEGVKKDVKQNLGSGIALPTQDIFTPASPSSITQYKKLYSTWIKKYEKLFEKIHLRMNLNTTWPTIDMAIGNFGSRFATDTLITFQVKGPFKITPTDVYEEIQSSEIGNIKFPSPPIPPKGRWDRVDALSKFAKDLHLFNNPSVANPLFDSFGLDQLSKIRSTRDPNEFYYKPNKPIGPQQNIIYECEQWRHGVEEEIFSFVLTTDQSEGTLKGAIEISLNASNLTKPIKKRFNINFRVSKGDTKSGVLSLISMENNSN